MEAGNELKVPSGGATAPKIDRALCVACRRVMPIGLSAGGVLSGLRNGEGGKDGWILRVKAVMWDGKSGPLRFGAIVSPLRRPLEKLRKKDEPWLLRTRSERRLADSPRDVLRTRGEHWLLRVRHAKSCGMTARARSCGRGRRERDPGLVRGFGSTGFGCGGGVQRFGVPRRLNISGM